MKQKPIQIPASQTVRYELLALDIHELVFLESSRRAVDEAFAILEEIYRHYRIEREETSHKIGLLLNATHAPKQSISYFFFKAREQQRKLEAEYAEFIRPTTQVRVVVLYKPEDSFIMNMFDTFNATLRWKNLKVRYIREEDREQAIRWMNFPDA